LMTDSFSTGFAWFSMIVNLIASAWASKHNYYGTTDSSDFTNTALTWQSFAIIAGALTFFINGFLIFVGGGENKNKPGPSRRLIGLVVAIIFCTLIGLVAALFDKHFFTPEKTRRGTNMLIVAASPTDNYGNSVSPFAWPISIWTSSVCAGFALEVLINGGSTGIAALAVTEAALLIGWAANHTYFGSAIYDSLDGLTRAWEGVALASALFVFLFALSAVMSSAPYQGTDSAPQVGDAGKRETLQADDFRTTTPGGQE